MAENVTDPTTPTPEGFTLLRLHYSVDPDKDEKWANKAKAEYPTDDWEREFELKTVGRKDSYPVFADYKRTLHEDEKLVWLPSKGKIIYRGWDFGKVHPCVEFAQIIGLRKNYLDEIYGEDIFIEALVQQVLAHSHANFPGCTFVDWVDVSGRNVDQWGNSSMGTLKKYGLHPKGKDQEVEEGIQGMKRDLVMLDDGRPYLMVNPAKCPHLSAAMRGGLKRNKKGEIVKDGTNDHPVDAARYLHQGASFERGKNWDDIRTKMKQQYNRFPNKGRQVRR